MTERFRPAYHFTPAAHWMNDPNGMVFFEGEYHLFYQHNPDDIVHGPMYWGHAVSRDLVHWQHLPIGLKPDHNGVIFSGSAVVDWKDTTGFFHGQPGLVAIFTHHRRHPESGAAEQRQSLAYSSDRGRTWTMYAGNPVLESPEEPDFRDPKVFWHESEQRWIMVLAVKNKVSFYSSPNLKEWSFLSHFSGGSQAGVWECPDMFPLQVEETNDFKWVLEVDINPGAVAGGSGGQYFVGNFDGQRFIPDDPADSPLWLDYGKDHYAGVSWSDVPAADGRRLWLGWMSNWQYANHTPTSGWRNAMTVPRQLQLRSVGGRLRLVQTPVHEIQSLRTDETRLKSVSITHQQPLQVAAVGQCLDMQLDVQLQGCTEWGIRLCKGQNEETLVGYDSSKQELFVDRTHSGLVDFHPEFTGRRSAPLASNDGELSLRILVDRCSVEVFAQDGLVSITELIFPDAASGDLELFVKDNAALLHQMTIHTLQA